MKHEVKAWVLALLVLGTMAACGAQVRRHPWPDPCGAEPPRCEAGGYWVLPPDVEPVNDGDLLIMPRHDEFRWFCDSVLLHYPSEEMGVRPLRRCMSSDHVYRLPARIVDGEIIADESALGGGEINLGRIDGEVLLAPGARGTTFEMVWVSDHNPIAMRVWRGLRESRRGFYPSIPECNAPAESSTSPTPDDETPETTYPWVEPQRSGSEGRSETT